MSILLQTLAMIIWKPNYKSYPTLLPSDPFHIGERGDHAHAGHDSGASPPLSLAALMWLVNSTKLGRAMRATAENPRVAGADGRQARRGDFSHLRHRRGAGGALPA
jgi:branched-chain amino acid transport system permease protein